MRESRTQYPEETENLVIVELSDQESNHEGKLKSQAHLELQSTLSSSSRGGERSNRGAHMMFMFALNELLSLVFT